MLESCILKDSTATLVSYPRIAEGGAVSLRQPTSVTVRIGTPATRMPVAGVAGTVDDAVGFVGTAAAVGSDILVLAVPSDDVVGFAGNGSSGVDVSPREIARPVAALSPFTTYDVAVDLTLVGTVGGGQKIGTIVAVVSVDADTATIESQTLDLTTDVNGGSGAWTCDLTLDGLFLVFEVTGALVDAGIVVNFALVITATPRASDPGVFVAGRQYLLAGDNIRNEIEASFVTDSEIEVAEPLTQAVPVGTQILGWAVSKALTSAQTAIVGECVALWTATFSDGTTATWAQDFRVVRRLPIAPLSPSELTRDWPVVRNLLNRQDKTGGGELIRAAWENDVIPLLAVQSPPIRIENVMSWPALKPVLAMACLRRLLLLKETTTPDVRTALEAQWASVKVNAFNREDWYDSPQDVDPTPARAGPPPIRTGYRLVR